jgi:hypothetical protein
MAFHAAKITEHGSPVEPEAVVSDLFRDRIAMRRPLRMKASRLAASKPEAERCSESVNEFHPSASTRGTDFQPVQARARLLDSTDWKSVVRMDSHPLSDR